MKEGNSINFMVNKFPRNQASGLRFQKMPLPKVFRVLKLVSLQCPAKPTVLLGLFWCFKSADTHILINQRPHHEEKLNQPDSTVRKNDFQHFVMIAASRTNVHQ